MKKTFTLIELIVVIAIIAVLAAIIAPNAFRAIEKSKVAATVNSIRTLKTGLQSYYVDTGQWPSEIAPGYLDHTSLLQDDGNAGWDGPYLETWNERNPWGGRWQIRSELTGTEWMKLNEINLVLVLNNDIDVDVPDESALRLDTLIDDGDLTTGDMVSSCIAGRCEHRINVATIGPR